MVHISFRASLFFVVQIPSRDGVQQGLSVTFFTRALSNDSDQYNQKKETGSHCFTSLIHVSLPDSFLLRATYGSN